jgi:cyanophycinase
MPGPIGLQGGLEHYEATLPIDRRMLDEVGVFAPDVVILPFASFKSQEESAGALAREHWTRLGARARVVIPGHGSDDLVLDEVRGADVIVLPGGVPSRLFGALSGTPILAAIIARWEAGAGLTGSSAGAIDLFERRLNLFLPDPFRLIPGFGLLHGFVVAPHFDRLRVRRWFSPFLRRMGGLAVLGIDESTGLVGRDGHMQVLGTGSVTIATDQSIEVYPTGAVFDIDLTGSTRSRAPMSAHSPTSGRENGCQGPTWPLLGSTMRDDTSTASKSEPSMTSSSWRTSLFQRGSGAPEMYQGDPLSARTIP